MRQWISSLVLLSLVCPPPPVSAAPPVTAVSETISVMDTRNRPTTFRHAPRKVVCLTPYLTDMLVDFGQGERLVGLTRQDLLSHAGLGAVSIGSYFSPDVEAIQARDPDLILVAPSHVEVIQRFEGSHVSLMVMEARTLDQAFAHMEWMGRIFGCEAVAESVAARNREQMALVRARLAAIPETERKRVVRVMAGKEPTCPGDDSFQNEIITAAGGVPPKWGKNGFAVPVEPGAWRRFNPQFIYGCDLNETAVRDALQKADWKEVDAVQSGTVAMFPCELTCRVSTRTGAFIQWMAARLYPDLFADPQKAVREDTVLEERPVDIGLDYVDGTRVVTHRVADAQYQSVAIRFKRPLDVLSTLEGPRSAMRGVGNTSIPMYASLGHMARGIADAQRAIAKNLGFAVEEYAGLMTGANMDCLSIQRRRSGNLEVTALVTAGVRGNALRMSEHTEAHAGQHEGAGTINIIVLTNHRLSAGAMAWASVVITEAKTAALLDLDIRSTRSPWTYRATGTGTDTLVVVQGEGPDAPHAGGHTRIGQLIAAAVHAGVTEAVFRQNGIHPGRELIHRLNERRLRLEAIPGLYGLEAERDTLVPALEALLAAPYYVSFLETAMAVSDEHRKGFIRDLDFFDAMCASVNERLAGRPGLTPVEMTSGEMSVVMDRAFGALIAGIRAREAERKRP